MVNEVSRKGVCEFWRECRSVVHKGSCLFVVVGAMPEVNASAECEYLLGLEHGMPSL